MSDFNLDFIVKFPDNHSIEHLKFVFYQAEKRLDESHKNFDSTTTKSVTLITLSVALLSTLVAYFFINNEISGVFSPKLFTVCLIVLFTLIYLSNNVKPINYQPSGSSPSLLLTESLKVPSTKDSEMLHLKDVYYSEIVNYDKRIKINFSINEQRLQRINRSINALISIPITGLIIYIITSFLFSSFH